MARYFFRVLALLMILAPLVRAQEPLPPPPPGEPPAMDRPERPGDKPEREGRDRDGRKRRRMENSPPGEEGKFRENMERWKRMSPDDKGVMREMYRRKREAMDREIQRAIEQSKLDLNDEQKKDFKQRYMRERHEIETKLRKQLDEQRRVLIDEMIEKLREEFASGTASTATTIIENADDVPVVEAGEE